jgi:hypothetical protein
MEGPRASCVHGPRASRFYGPAPQDSTAPRAFHFGPGPTDNQHKSKMMRQIPDCPRRQQSEANRSTPNATHSTRWAGLGCQQIKEFPTATWMTKFQICTRSLLQQIRTNSSANSSCKLHELCPGSLAVAKYFDTLRPLRLLHPFPTHVICPFTSTPRRSGNTPSHSAHMVFLSRAPARKSPDSTRHTSLAARTPPRPPTPDPAWSPTPR